jgi:hypothetical protein
MSLTTSTLSSPGAATYAARVRACLADLPEESRAELLEDLEEHLAEVLADDGGASLSERLGSPAAYASELRTAAGLAPIGVGSQQAWIPALRIQLARLARRPGTRAALELWTSLKPGWWVLRGLLVSAYLLRNARPGRLGRIPVPQVQGSRWLGLAVIVGLVALSVLVGRRLRTRSALAATLVVALDLAVAVAGVGATTDALHRTYTFRAPPVIYNTSSDTLTGPNGIIYNIIPFDREGRALTDVQLFDQSGNPLNVAVGQDPRGLPLQRIVARAPDGGPLNNVFPQTQIVTDPTTGTAGPAPAPSLTPSTVPTVTSATSPAAGSVVVPQGSPHSP